MPEESKTLNAYRNTTFGFILKIFQLLIPFVVRTVIIKVLGMEYAGLNSLFTSVLQVLNIAELGVSTAMVFSMYKPIAEKDTEKISALMNLYKIYYRIIGTVILCAGAILTPFLPYLISGDVPADINLYIIYWINLLATVFSYWLFAYKNSLFIAHQRNDVISKITFITDFIKYSLQILLLFLLKNYYVYLIVLVVMQIVNNIVIAIAANKKYPEYLAKGKLDREERKKINSSIKDLFYSKIGMVVTNSVDSIVISIFLGLIPLAIYQNYYYILNALLAFFTIFFSAFRSGIGNNLITQSLEKNYNDFKFITYISCAALAFCTPCLLTMYQPFIELWVGADNMLDEWCVLLFGLYFLVDVTYQIIATYKDAAGMWHKDRFRPLIAAIFNLSVNILLVHFIGIYGIQISTIAAFALINIPWTYVRLFKDVFNKEQAKDYLFYLLYKLLVIIIVTVVCCVATYFLPISNLWVKLVVNLGICTITSVTLYILLNIRDSSFKRAIGLIRHRIKRK